MSPTEFKFLIKESFGGVPSKEDWVSDKDRSRFFKLGLVKGYGKDKEDREELFGYKNKPKKELMRLTEEMDVNTAVQIFKNIRTICDEYLRMRYPAAPDPMHYLQKIERELYKHEA